MAASAQFGADDKRGSAVLVKERFAPGTVQPGNIGSNQVRTLEFDLPATLCFLDGSRERVPVVVRSVSRGFFRVTCSHPLMEKRAVSLTVEDTALPGVTAFCVPIGADEFRIGIEVWAEGSDRRKEVRIVVKIPAKMRTPTMSRSEMVDIELTDVSSSGCGFITPVECAAGMPIIIDLGHGMIFAEVKHSTPTSGGFRTGCAIEEYIALSGDRQNSAYQRTSNSFWRSAGRRVTGVASHLLHGSSRNTDLSTR